MIHLVHARGANLLLAGNSFQISTGFQRRPSSRDSLEMALSWFPLLQGFCAPLKVACSSRLSIATANYLVGAKGDCCISETSFKGREVPIIRRFHISNFAQAQTACWGETCVIFPVAL